MRLKHIVRLIPLASFGVVLGHIFVYRHLFANPVHTHDVLENTGHAYFGTATLLATAIATVSLAAYGWMSYRDKRQKLNDHGVSFWRNFAVLYLVQLVLFVGMELGERANAHGSVDVVAFFGSSVFTLGIVFQLATAAFVALIVSGAVKAGELVASIFKSKNVHTNLAIPFTPKVHSFEHLHLSNIRGPPM